MSRKGLPLLLALCAPMVAEGSGLSANQPLSSWHSASTADKRQLIDAIVNQLRSSAGITTDVGVPMDAIAQCVDENHTPDTLTFHGHDAKVTTGLVVVLCVKIHVPQLQKVKYTVHGD